MKTTIKNTTMMLAILLATVLGMRTAQASIVFGPSTVQVAGANGAAPLSVDYYVSLCGATYTYYFVITPPQGSGASSFTVDISDPATVSDITSTSSAYVPPPVINNGVSITWDFADLTSTATNSFKSQFSPEILGMSSAAAINGYWVDPPTVVPEASTIMAGMLMILPLSYGVFRTLRKGRDFNDQQFASAMGLKLSGLGSVPNTSKDVPPGNRFQNQVGI
jgi:hypothetical protein